MDSREQLEIIDLINRAALELRESREGPAAIEAIVGKLLHSGLDFAGLHIHLFAGEEPFYTRYTFYPVPMSWDMAERSPGMGSLQAYTSQQMHSWQGGGQRETWWFLGLPSTLGTVEFCRWGDAGFAEEDRAFLAKLVLPLETFAVRHRDLHAFEMAQSQVAQLDTDLLALHDGSCDLSGKSSDEVGRKIIEMATGHLGFDRAGIFLADFEADVLRGAWGTDDQGNVANIATTVFSLHPQRVEELTEAARVVRGELAYFLTRDLDGEGRGSKEGDIRANLSVPMRVGERIIGVLSVDNYFTDRPINSAQIQPLMVLANQGAAALESVRFYQEVHDAYQLLALEVVERKKAEVLLQSATDELEQRVEERTEELEEQRRLLLAFQDIARTTLASLDLEQILDDLPRQILRTGIFRGLTLALADEESQSVEVVRSFTLEREPGGELKEVINQHRGLRYGLEDENPIAEVARTGQLQLIEGWNELFDRRASSPEERRRQVAYAMPIKKGDRVLGVLVSGSSQDKKEGMLRHIEAMEPLLDQIAVALEHASLYGKLQASEERYRTLLERLPIGIVTTTAEDRLYYNPRGLEMLGLEKSDLPDLQSSQIYVDRRDYEELRQELDRHGFHEYEYWLRRKDGEKILVRGKSVTMCDQEGKPLRYEGYMEDITEQRRGEEAREAAEGELEEQRALSLRSDRLRSLGEMAAGMAHELNQPLVGVRGLAEHMLIAMDRGWDLGSGKLRERLGKIVSQVDRMVHIIDHVRLFAREANRSQRVSVQVNDVVRAGAEMLGAQLRAHGIILDCELGENLPSVMANPFALEEVVLNLMANARDAVEEELKANNSVRGQVSIRSISAATAAGSHIRIEIADTGAGIPTEIQDRVFEPFFTTKDPDKGTGLGLAISRSIVEDLGGTLEICSNAGMGTTMAIVLPVEETHFVEEAL